MKENRCAYIPRDRLVAIAGHEQIRPFSSGSILFVDISGFTPMTEAFEASLGVRQGGEELARILNEVYDSLISEVDNQGGSVIGFAGDAITCWFMEDNGLRALNSSFAIQRCMEQFNSIPSPAGGVLTLGVKAAVSIGAVKRFDVGDTSIQRVDVMAGDPVYRVAAIEGLANRGEVVIDQATSEALGTQVEILETRKGEKDGPSCYIVESVQPVDEALNWPPLHQTNVPRELIDPWILLSIRERIGSGLSEFITELRPATALFVKFEGIDFEQDCEAAEKLNQFFSSAQQVVADYDGILHQLTVGDKGSFFYAAFGAPVSHEDDTVRAMLVALEVRKIAESLQFIKSVHMGIGRGTTRTGPYGGVTRRTYGVLGDRVNLAARLMGKAAPGQILVSEEANLEAGDAFNMKRLDPIRVKGKSEPVIVYDLLSRKGDLEQSVSEYSIPMVGRKQELDMIGGWLREAIDGRGQVIELIADAGMGKTRLMHECIQSTVNLGFRIFRGDCQTFGSSTQYRPWWPIWRDYFSLEGNLAESEAARKVEAILSSIGPNLVQRLPLLSSVLNLPLQDNEFTEKFDPDIRRSSLEGLLVECLRTESARQPLMIILEDAHAIDGGSSQLFKVFVQAIARLPVLLVVVRRPAAGNIVLGSDELSLDYVHRVNLKAFDPQESHQLIHLKGEQLFGKGDDLSDGVIKKITSRTGGNPFFIEEVMNWICHQNVTTLSEEVLDSVELPTSLHSLVLSRMDQLEEGSLVTMKVASVIGREFRANLVWGAWPELGDSSRVRKALRSLVDRDFTERKDTDPELAYLFKHVVIQEVAYESLPYGLRTRIHESIGLHVENEIPAQSVEVLDLLAFHFSRSKNTGKKRQYLLLAGDASMDAYAYSSAAEYYNAVLPLLDNSEKVPVLRNLGRVLEIVGDWHKAMETHKQALALSLEKGLLLEVMNCRMDIGDLLRKMGTFDEASTWLSTALEGYSELGHQPGIGQVLHNQGTLAAQTGKYDLAKELYAQSIKIRRELGDESKVAALVSNMGIISRFQGDLEQALKLQEEGLEIRRRLEDPFSIGNSLNNLGMAKRYLGNLDGARKDLEEALSILQQIGDRAEIANTLNSLAEVALDQEDSQACETFLLESLQLTRELGNLRALAFLFEAFAFNAAIQGSAVRCLYLFGASRSLRKTIGAPLPKADEGKIQDKIKDIRQTNSNIEVDKLLDKGASISLSNALDFAAGKGNIE